MCIQVKRRIIEDLRPTTLANFGLMTAARELAEQTAERAGWKLTLELPGEEPRSVRGIGDRPLSHPAGDAQQTPSSTRARRRSA
jgi:hypothetical protein